MSKPFNILIINACFWAAQTLPHVPPFPSIFGVRCSIFDIQSSNIEHRSPKRETPAQTPDSAIFAEKQAIAAAVPTMREKNLAIARSFLGTPYLHGTLEVNESESLVVNLSALDCWTFVENCVALAQTQHDGGNYQSYLANLQQLRYWGGHIEGYGSRIHYFSGWILQAEKLGYLHDVTKSMSGIPYKKKVHFISDHPQEYPMTRQPGVLQAIRRAEARINGHAWHFIPKRNIRRMENQIREGDIILLCSSKHDLDVAHQGFAVREKGRIHLLHASSLHHRVVISNEPLHEYMAGQLGQSGIMVIRL
jgi:hypothetical protein